MDAPSLSEYWPGTHIVQFDAVVVLVNCPAVQSWQLRLPPWPAKTATYCPTSHAMVVVVVVVLVVVVRQVHPVQSQSDSDSKYSQLYCVASTPPHAQQSTPTTPNTDYGGVDHTYI